MYYPSASEILLHLSLIDGVGPQACATLCASFQERMHELYHVNAHELRMRSSLPLPLCHAIVAGLADKALLDKELNELHKNSISLVTLSDQEYPALLRHIHAPPAVLYYQGGNLASLSPALAFVGSRKADLYGQHATAHLIPEVVREGFTTISGGALGIDGMVHRATLNAGGITVAILGSGLLRPYPAAHTGLFQEIIHTGGLMMSSFPLTFQPLPQNFPARNRIIAGLSRATVVIQAAVKSGALLTARNALDEGRDVGVVPGSIFNELSAGCHELLVHGARAITRPQDIFELISYQIKDAPVPPTFHPFTEKKGSQDPLVALCSTPKSTDELMLQAGYSYDTLHDRLWQLQIEGRIEQNILGMWVSL